MSDNKRRVLLVNSAIYLPGEGGYKRTMYLFDMMTGLGYNPRLITTDFNHYSKSKRDILKFRNDFPDYNNIEFLSIPTYTKNISYSRYRSGQVWTKVFYNWFKKHYNEFDVVYLNMPDIFTILKIEDICRKNGIKIIVDIRDLRPEVFKVIIKNDFIYRIATYNLKRMANKAYAVADEMLAVSEEYLQRGMSQNNRAKNPKAVYIGSVLDEFYKGIEIYQSNLNKEEDEFWITYAGTLGESYDLFTLLDAAKILSVTHKNVRIKILGQGPSEGALKKYVTDNSITNVDFVGFVEYKKMAAYLSKSEISINSLKKRSSQSIINKVADYLAAGIPMLNASTCEEMCRIIDDNEVGINYEPENVKSIVDAIIFLYENKSLCEKYGANAKHLALEKFDRKKSYLKIIETIDNV